MDNTYKEKLNFLLSFAKPRSIEQRFVLAARYAQIGRMKDRTLIDHPLSFNSSHFSKFEGILSSIIFVPRIPTIRCNIKTLTFHRMLVERSGVFLMRLLSLVVSVLFSCVHVQQYSRCPFDHKQFIRSRFYSTYKMTLIALPVSTPRLMSFLFA